MLIRTLSAALLLTATVAAQEACPHLRAKAVATAQEPGAYVACSSGVDMTVGNVHVTTGSEKGCPLTVLITPSHEEPEATTAATKVLHFGGEPRILLTFRCVPNHFLFFVVSSTCESDSQTATGMVQHLVTVPCENAAVLP